MGRKSILYRGFETFNYLLLVIIAISCVLPIVHYLAQSFSLFQAVQANQVGLWPVGFQLQGYIQAFRLEALPNSFLVTIKRVILGGVIGLSVTAAAAYALSKGQDVLRGHKWYISFFVIALLFNGGLIPTYLLVKSLGLLDTIWALVLPGAVNVFNMILLLNFFKGLPKELEEAAMIDGASHFDIFTRIYLPLSMPVIATVALFTLVTDWNSWFDGAIYMNSENAPLATYLHNLLMQPGIDANTLTDQQQFYKPQMFKAPIVFITILPIMFAYPFLQRYFAKGIMLGGVKE
ncbi:carbohydrate ABC transporter permease [Ammoniphilus sp. 3BR4]|uniref:carbohydrate ABC transporter permease n=1 Tax=Ammoniphilus sp. 3BR4 TaxID=3158265 RepID=UPI003466EB42